MQQRQFRNKVTINAPISNVYSYLATYQNMIHLHPLIVEIKEIPTTDPNKTTLDIKDKIILFGFLPIYKTYQASVELNPDEQSITMETFTSPNIHIKNRLQFHADDDHTTVNEETLVETSRFLMNYVFKQVVYSHSNMLSELKNRVEKQLTDTKKQLKT